MPAAISHAIRHALWAAAQQQVSVATLAQRFHLPPRTVRHLLRLGRLHGAIPEPRYQQVMPPTDATTPLYQRALALKTEHPRWGSRYLLGVLAQYFPHDELPSERTLRRWLHRERQPTAPPGRRVSTTRATVAHQRWQIDACDQMPLQNGAPVSWLRVVDECTGAVLGTKVFPPRSVQPSARHTGATTISGVV